MNVRYLAGFLSIGAIVLLPQLVSASTYEVQITREQHRRFIQAARVWQEPQPDDILSSQENGYKIIDRLDCEQHPPLRAGGNRGRSSPPR